MKKLYDILYTKYIYTYIHHQPTLLEYSYGGHTHTHTHTHTNSIYIHIYTPSADTTRVLIWGNENVFSYYRICSLTTECVLLLS